MNSDIRSLIIYEDRQIIVCRKPAGIPVQSAKISAVDIVSLLKNYLADTFRNRGGGREPYLAVIHRLDQPVEGLLVFAKTPAAAKDLNRQLTSSRFGKYYRAVVNGIPEPSMGTLENYLVKDGRSNTSRVCEKDTPGAKHARLHYRVKEVCDSSSPVTSLVEIRLDTGRHHQIRVQMAHLGCPLVGDRKYGSRTPGRERSAKERSAGKRSAHRNGTDPLRLCADRLEFLHPLTGKDMAFELPEVWPSS